MQSHETACCLYYCRAVYVKVLTKYLLVHFAYNCWNASEGIAGHVEFSQGWDTADRQWEVS